MLPKRVASRSKRFAPKPQNIASTSRLELARSPFVLTQDAPIGNLPLFPFRLRPSTITRDRRVEDFYSDKSRIIFCSSFRRLMQKAQVFSLESNTSVRNRLTHSIEVADIGRTLARHVGKKLQSAKLASEEEVQSMISGTLPLGILEKKPLSVGSFGMKKTSSCREKTNSHSSLRKNVKNLKNFGTITFVCLMATLKAFG